MVKLARRAPIALALARGPVEKVIRFAIGLGEPCFAGKKSDYPTQGGLIGGEANFDYISLHLEEG